MQANHERATAPYLTFNFQAAYANGRPVDPQIELENVGQELALNCLYCARVVWERPDVEVLPGVREQVVNEYRFPPASAFASPFHLAPGKPQLGMVHEITDFDFDFQAILTGLDYRLGLIEAVACQDRSGTRYRFRSDRALPDQWRPSEPILGWVTWIPLPISSS
jgi:hypothetical protein